MDARQMEKHFNRADDEAKMFESYRKNQEKQKIDDKNKFNLSERERARKMHREKITVDTLRKFAERLQVGGAIQGKEVSSQKSGLGGDGTRQKEALSDMNKRHDSELRNETSRYGKEMERINKERKEVLSAFRRDWPSMREH